MLLMVLTDARTRLRRIHTRKNCASEGDTECISFPPRLERQKNLHSSNENPNATLAPRYLFLAGRRHHPTSLKMNASDSFGPCTQLLNQSYISSNTLSNHPHYCLSLRLTLPRQSPPTAPSAPSPSCSCHRRRHRPCASSPPADRPCWTLASPRRKPRAMHLRICPRLGWLSVKARHFVVYG